MHVRTIMCVSALLLGACASSQAGHSTASRSQGAKKNENVITAAEISASHEHDAYDLIKSVRPNMLVVHGNTSLEHNDPSMPGIHGTPTPGTVPGPDSDHPQGNNAIIVFLNGQRLGGVSLLRRMSTTDIREIRFLTPAQAQYQYGQGYPQGVILITTGAS
ncbi:MAG TPA: hypothetical protein VFW98_07960 [Gemmatimonadaceae bacterium]|nr:hypothetical protein [Gemmatimonadaceae bacterium]